MASVCTTEGFYSLWKLFKMMEYKIFCINTIFSLLRWISNPSFQIWLYVASYSLITETSAVYSGFWMFLLSWDDHTSGNSGQPVRTSRGWPKIRPRLKTLNNCWRESQTIWEKLSCHLEQGVINPVLRGPQSSRVSCPPRGTGIRPLGFSLPFHPFLAGRETPLDCGSGRTGLMTQNLRKSCD